MYVYNNSETFPVKVKSSVFLILSHSTLTENLINGLKVTKVNTF